MTNALDLGRPVIIHCIDGVNRSLAITVAYLFEQAKLSGIEGRNDSRVMCDMISLCASKRKGVKTINSLKELSQENIQYYGMTLRSVVEYYLGCSWGSKAPSPALALAAASALRFEGTPGCGAGGAIHPAAGVGRRSEVSAVDPTAEVVPDYLADINTKIKNFTAPGFEEISDEKLREMIERGDWSNLKSKMATHVGYDISMYLPFADMGSGLFLGNDNATTKIFEEKRKLTTIEINRLNEQMWLTGSEDGVALIGHPGFDSLPGALSDGTNFDLILCVAAYTSERATDIALIRNTFRSYGKFNGSGGKEFDIFTGRNAQRFIYCPCDEKDDISNFHTQFLPYSEKIFASMDATLSSGGQVLVHCMGGQHRSATALFSYIKTRLPHLNCWRIINYMRHVRDVVKDPHDALKGNRKSNMLNSAIRYFVGTPCAWVSE
ncbi:hypothetical protein FJ366_01305 [Candidatus Dependentiae bacterium]|nr:hypothetical protein [Candidatus Dependentiae bacterium]